MAYIINGPTQIGDVGQLNEIKGTLQLDFCTATGDLIYSSNASGLMARLPIGTAGQFLTVVAGLPAWTSSSTTETGFSARLSAAAATIAAPFANVTIGGGSYTWSTATAPEFDTTAGAFSTTTGVYTAPSAGTVSAQAAVSLLSSTNGGLRSMSLVFNKAGTPQYYTVTAQPSANNAIPLTLHAAAQLSLVATNTLEVEINSTAASGTSSVQTGAGTWFSLSKNFTP